jgi:methylmalonyl-CoA/ethylmalonyl-CoA epimerase
MNHSVKPRIRIGEIYQIGIVVHDVATSVERYWTTLGVGPWHIYRIEPPILEAVTLRGQPIVISMRVALAHSGPVQLELIEPLEGPSIYEEFLATRGEGLHHIQSRVEDPDAMLDAFKAMGINVLMSAKVGDNVFYYMDSEPLLGIIYEFGKRTGPPTTSLYRFEGTYPATMPSRARVS